MAPKRKKEGRKKKSAAPYLLSTYQSYKQNNAVSKKWSQEDGLKLYELMHYYNAMFNAVQGLLQNHNTNLEVPKEPIVRIQDFLQTSGRVQVGQIEDMKRKNAEALHSHLISKLYMEQDIGWKAVEPSTTDTKELTTSIKTGKM